VTQVRPPDLPEATGWCFAKVGISPSATVRFGVDVEHVRLIANLAYLDMRTSPICPLCMIAPLAGVWRP